MNPFAAKLVGIQPDVFNNPRRSPFWLFQPYRGPKPWIDFNETVIVWGWQDGKYLLSRENGTFEIHRCERVRLRLFRPGDVIPPSILQMVQGGQRPGGR